jgi:GntR family transcriptional regulator/MocR family aminotransferase
MARTWANPADGGGRDAQGEAPSAELGGTRRGAQGHARSGEPGGTRRAAPGGDGAAAAGLDLHLDLTGPRIRTAVEAALRQAVQSGRLPAGTRLPATRGLAADLGVARNTVADAYGQLVAEGWLTARQGSGTRVAEQPAAHPSAGPVELPAGPPGEHSAARPAPGYPAHPGGLTAPARTAADPARARPADPAGIPGTRRLVAAEPRPLRYSLRPGVPDLGEFPRAAWLAAARHAITAAPSEAFGYGDARGRPELRAALASYLARARGVRATPDRIVICSGFTQALALLCRVLAADGVAEMAAEVYGHQHHRNVIAAQGLSCRQVPVDENGAVITAADEFSGAGALLLTPSHQFPLGVPLAPDRRGQAVAWAARTGRVVIEDDYDGEFRYDRRAIGAMQALAPEHVVYAGTASKTLAPAVRLAWLVLPARLLDPFVAAKLVTDLHGSSLDELALAELINSGGYDRHVRRARLLYRRRRDRLVAALARAVPDARVTGVAAGLHAVLFLPPGMREADVIASAAGRSLALDGMRTFQPRGVAHPAALVLGYATPPAHAFTTAVSRLCAALRDCS